MDPYELQLKFITEALPQQEAAHCRKIFYEVAKRDIRKAVYYLLQPTRTVEESLEALENTPTLEHLEEVLAQYCPNKSYQQVVHQAAKGHPFTLEKRLLERLQQFKRAPRKATLQQIWKIVAEEEALLLAYLKGLQYYSHELVHLWPAIDRCLLHEQEDIVKRALELLARMPQGVERSLPRITHLLRQPEWQFKALKALQQSHNLPSLTVQRLIQPILDAYRKYPNKRNNLWPEFRIIQSIARNNKVHLTLPDLDLERF
ncbi:MAG: hypothetical protein ACRBFS_02735 [Aureispira sp.]